MVLLQERTCSVMRCFGIYALDLRLDTQFVKQNQTEKNYQKHPIEAYWAPGCVAVVPRRKGHSRKKLSRAQCQPFCACQARPWIKKAEPGKSSLWEDVGPPCHPKFATAPTWMPGARGFRSDRVLLLYVPQDWPSVFEPYFWAYEQFRRPEEDWCYWTIGCKAWPIYSLESWLTRIIFPEIPAPLRTSLWYIMVVKKP